MTKTDFVLNWLKAHGIDYEVHYHPPLYTIEEAMAYWENVDSTHCKNLFFRNHKGNRHYMASFECHKNLQSRAYGTVHRGISRFGLCFRFDT